MIFDEDRPKQLNHARLTHLRSLGLPLSMQMTLEVGAGPGLLTGFFEMRGPVFSIEGRPALVQENLLRHPWREGTVLAADVRDLPEWFLLYCYDIVFCYGALYHTDCPAKVLGDLAHMCQGLFLLETCVSRFDDGQIHPVTESGAGMDQSLDQHGCHPARDWVWDRLHEHYEYVYLSVTQPNHKEFPLAWPPPVHHTYRSIFVGSRHELALPTLSDVLLMEQTRYER